MATIHKRRLVSGEVVWELSHGSGADRQRFTVGKTREEAQDVLNQFNKQIALHGQAPDDDGIEAILGRYVVYLRGNRRPSTFRRYVRVLKTFHRCFLAVRFPDVQTLRQVKPVHFEDYKLKRVDGRITEVEEDDAQERDDALRDEIATGVEAVSYKDNARFGWLGRKRLRRIVTQRTVNYELQALHTFYKWAVARNYLFVNPVSTVERFRIPKRSLPKFLTTDQLRKLLAACNEWERRLFTTILMTGMRKGEVAHLMWSDINFELNIIFIQEKPEWAWKPKTDERVIPISPPLRELLLLHYDKRTSDKLVFPNKEGNPDIHILPKLIKVCRKADIKPATVHSLRHSFGAHLRMAGVSLADIADLLGHKDLATTQIYAKVHQEHLRKAIAKLGSITTELPPGDATPRLLDSSYSSEDPSED